MQRPTGPRRLVYVALAAVALVVGFVDGVASHGTHGRLLMMLGFFALVFLTSGGAEPPPDV
jgi:hypothetical protein